MFNELLSINFETSDAPIVDGPEIQPEPKSGQDRLPDDFEVPVTLKEDIMVFLYQSPTCSAKLSRLIPGLYDGILPHSQHKIVRGKLDELKEEGLTTELARPKNNRDRMIVTVILTDEGRSRAMSVLNAQDSQPQPALRIRKAQKESLIVDVQPIKPELPRRVPKKTILPVVKVVNEAEGLPETSNEHLQGPLAENEIMVRGQVGRIKKRRDNEITIEMPNGATLIYDQTSAQFEADTLDS